MPDHTSNFYVAIVLALAFLIAAPVSIWRSRRGPRELQRRTYCVWLGASLLVLAWYDAGMLALALMDDLRDADAFAYARLTALLGLTLLALAPYGGRDTWRTLAGVAAVTAWGFCLPSLPTNHEKREILGVMAAMDRPLDALVERFGAYHADLIDGQCNVIESGKLADLHLEGLPRAELRLDPIGGLFITVVDGTVRDAWFNYD